MEQGILQPGPAPPPPPAHPTPPQPSHLLLCGLYLYPDQHHQLPGEELSLRLSDPTVSCLWPVGDATFLTLQGTRPLSQRPLRATSPLPLTQVSLPPGALMHRSPLANEDGPGRTQGHRANAQNLPSLGKEQVDSEQVSGEGLGCSGSKEEVHSRARAFPRRAPVDVDQHTRGIDSSPQ